MAQLYGRLSRSQEKDMLTGIDVSHYENDMDYGAAYAAGARFIVHKATQGTSYVDPTYLRRRPLIAASGAVPGRYHFLEERDPVGQVHFHLDECGSPAGELIQLDWEPPAKGLPAATPKAAQAFHDEWRSETNGHPLPIYYPHWVWEGQEYPNVGDLIQEPLWASHYIPGIVSFADTHLVPGEWWLGYAGWSRATFFQFAGDNGRILGEVADLNMFDGDTEKLLRLTGGNSMSDWGPLGPPPNLNEYQRANLAVGLADVIAQLCYGVSGYGDGRTADSSGLFIVNSLRVLLDDQGQILQQYAQLRDDLRALSGITNWPEGPFALSDADVARIAAAVVDLQAKRLENG